MGCLCFGSTVNSARILGVFTATGKSHFIYNEAIMKALHAAGHDITFINAFPQSETPQNYTVIDSRINEFVYVGQSSVNDFVPLDLIGILKFELMWAEKPCYDIMQLDKIQV